MHEILAKSTNLLALDLNWQILFKKALPLCYFNFESYRIDLTALHTSLKIALRHSPLSCMKQVWALVSLGAS